MLRRRGLTLIEFVITIAIVAVLAVMVVPNLGKWIQHYRIRGAVREIVSQMELAKIKALKNNLEYQVVFDSNAGSFWLERGNRPNSSRIWTQEGGVFRIPRQVQIENVTFHDDAAQFNPHGTAATGGLELRTTNGERYRITVITTTGKINTKKVN